MLTTEQKQDAKILMLEAIKDRGGMAPSVFAFITATAVRKKYPGATAMDLAIVAGELLDEGFIDDGGYCDNVSRHVSN